MEGSKMSEENTLPETDTTPSTDAKLVNDEALATEAFAELEDASVYVEERAAQEKEESGEDTSPPQEKRASRYSRLKKARDQYRQEAEQLRAQLGQTTTPQETPPANPYEDEIDQGRREAEFAHQLAQRDEQVARATELRLRSEEAAQQFPDYHETIEFAKDCGYNPGPVFTDLLMRHPQGPVLAYALAKDAQNGGDILMQLEALADNPVAQAKEFGKMEATFMQAVAQGRVQQPRTTQAPPPMRPISGGSAGPRDIHALAKADDVSAYAKARRRADG
jgi:hypothetical protein